MVRLATAECWDRLGRAERAVLATIHPDRGPDLVPVVLAVHDGRVVLPLDVVKPKSGRRLQRLENLEQDPRCTLLVDHYEADWERLWWVRLHGTAVIADVDDEALAALVSRYPRYREPGSVTGLIVVTATELTGWAARPD